MPKITLHVSPTEAKLIRLALSNVSVASPDFAEADRLQRTIGQKVEVHKRAQKNMKRIQKP